MKFHIKFVGLVSSVLVLLGSSEGASDCAGMDESQFRDLASVQGLDYQNPNVTFKCEAGAWSVHNPSLRTRASGLVTFATQGVCKDSSGFRSCWNYGGYVYNDRNKYTNTAKYFFAQNVYQREEAFDGKGETCTSDGAFCFDMINGMCFWSYMNQKWSKYCYELPLLTFDV
ncbi:hypothetical protein BGZ98_003276 [Dissophora globulifera]|nr:hypothetical protein BGZ98_003276 [Dissophora globulifera]